MALVNARYILIVVGLSFTLGLGACKDNDSTNAINNSIPSENSDVVFSVGNAGDIAQLAGKKELEGSLVVEELEGITELVLPDLQNVSGDIIVRSGVGLQSIDFGNLTDVGGDVEIEENEQLSDVNLSALDSVEGHLRILANPTLETVDLTALGTVGGDVMFGANPRLPNIGMNLLGTVGGDVMVSNNDALQTIELDSLDEVKGGITIQANAQLPSFGANMLGTVGGDVMIAENPSLPSIGLSSLGTVGGDVMVSNNDALQTIDFGALEKIVGGITIQANAQLPSFGANMLGTVGGDVMIAENPSLPSIGLSLLGTVGGDVMVSNNDVLQTIDFGALEKIVGGITIRANAQLPSFGANMLGTVGGDVMISDNPLLPNIGLSSLGTVGGDVMVSNNDALQTVNLGILTEVTGDITIQSNAQLPSVGATMLGTVGGDVMISDNPRMPNIGMTSLGTVGGDVMVSNNGALNDLDMQFLGTVGGDVMISGNPALEEATFAGLTGVGTNFSDPGALTPAGTNLIIRDNANLKTLSFPLLVRVLGMAAFENLPVLERLHLPQLGAGGDRGLTPLYLHINDNEALHTINIPRLSQTRGETLISGNPALATVDLSRLEIHAGTLELSNNDALEMLGFPALTTVESDLLIVENNALNTVLADNLTVVGDGSRISDNPSLSVCHAIVIQAQIEQGGIDISNNGASNEVSGYPGSSCGQCNLGLLECDANNNLICVDARGCPELEIQTLTASNVGARGATLHGEIMQLPASAVTDHGFCIGTEPEPTQNCEMLGGLSVESAFQVNVADLVPGTHYYFRAFAVVDGERNYADDEDFITLTIVPSGLVASQGQSAHGEHVALSWDEIEGAIGYIVYRDGIESANRLTPQPITQASYLDTEATPGSLPGEPTGVAASEGEFIDKVQINWQEADVLPGSDHTYYVQAVYPTEVSELSDGAMGHRAAYPVEYYQISVDGGDSWLSDQIMGLEWDDVNAPEGEIVAPNISASQGSDLSVVQLAMTGEPSFIPAQRSYRIRAVNARGEGSGSASISGFRDSGEFAYQWQRSSSSSASNFSDLSGATSTSFNDSSAPSSGQTRQYRLKVSAPGVEPAYSSPMAGWRGVRPAVGAVSVSSIDQISAELSANIIGIGNPAINDHGFCWSNTEGDAQNGTCLASLGSANATGSFNDTMINLDENTEYYVAAYVTNSHGTVWSDEALFVTLPGLVQDVTATEGASTDFVKLTWTAMSGVSSYNIYRDGTLIADEITASTYSDHDAEEGGVPKAPEISVSQGTESQYVEVSWEAPEVDAGTVHYYEITAINGSGEGLKPSDDAEVFLGMLTGFTLDGDGNPFGTPGYRGSAPILGYEICIGDDADNEECWDSVDTANGLVYYDTEAPLGEVVVLPADIHISQGDSTSPTDFVTLRVDDVSTNAANPQIYQVRAVNALGNGEASAAEDGEGHRKVGDQFRYEWFASDDGPSGPFESLTEGGSSAYHTYNDTEAPNDGSLRHYYVTVQTDGAEVFESDVLSGFRAVEADVLTLAATNIETEQAKLYGEILDLGVPSASDYGFCYGTMEQPGFDKESLDPTTTTCATKGSSPGVGSFDHVASDLEPGTKYYVRAYASNNAGTVYGAQQDFWTVPLAPANITATAQVNAVQISWDGVSGAHRYYIHRSEVGVGNPVEIGDVSGTTTTFSDTNVVGGVPYAPQVSVPGSPSTDHIRIEWSEPGVAPGVEYEYFVTAENINEYSSENSPSDSAAPLGSAIIEYQVCIGDNAEDEGCWQTVDTSVELAFEDINAPLGDIQVANIEASNGDSNDPTTYVTLTAANLSTNNGAEQTYQVRAVNSNGAGAYSDSNEGKGYRKVDETSYSFEWFYSDDGPSGPFESLTEGANSAYHTYDDADAPPNGDDRYYYVRVTADGAQAYDNEATPVSGFLAVPAQVSTLAPDDVEETSVTLYGEIDDTGKPGIVEHGFCIGVINPPHSLNAGCSELGNIGQGSFSQAIEDLLGGTQYFVRAYATTNAGISYGDVESFWTKPEAPTDVVATGLVNSVEITWDGVDGADKYRIFRRELPEGMIIEVDNISGNNTSYMDISVEGGVPQVPPNVTAGSTSTEFVRVEWQEPNVNSGDIYEYYVMAVNEEEASGDMSVADASSQAAPLGPEISGYEICIGDNAPDEECWDDVDISSGLAFEDANAPYGTIELGTFSASQGDSDDPAAYVTLVADSVSAINGAIQTYQIRAVNANGAGMYSDANHGKGYRKVDETSFSFEWFYSDTGSSGPFSTLTSGESNAYSSYNDTSAPANGDERYYYVQITADGADTFDNEATPVSGFRAVAAELTTVEVTDVEGTTAKFAASISDLGKPGATQHGFCYGTVVNPSLENAGCSQLGAPSQIGEFEESMTGLQEGAQYFVRAYATNNAGTAYGGEESFWTKPQAPTGVSATGQVNSIKLEWQAVDGAHKYHVYRYDPSEDSYEFEAEVGGDDTVWVDYSVEGGLPKVPSLSAPATLSPDYNKLEWNDPGVDEGDEVDYKIKAVNADSLSGPFSSSVQAAPLGTEIGFYEIEIAGSGNWIDVGNNLTWNDTNAPEGSITIANDTVSRGTELDRVILDGDVSAQPGASVSYRVRAVNQDGDGLRQNGSPSSSVTTNRIVEGLTVQWERTSTSIDDGNYSYICAGESCNDMNPPTNGEVRYYRIKATADGAETTYSTAKQGALAVPNMAFVGALPENITAGDGFSLSVQLYNQFSEALEIAGQNIELGTNKNLFSATFITLSQLTDNQGATTFGNVILTTADTNYELDVSATALSASPIITPPFDVVAGAASDVNSNITGISGLPADGIQQASITISIYDAHDNPIAGILPEFEADGAGDHYNQYFQCDETNVDGISTCYMATKSAETQNLKITQPFQKVGGDIAFGTDGFADGSGTNVDPYLVSTWEQLNKIGASSNLWENTHFKQIADLDLDGITINIIGNDTNSFKGVYDGSGYKIENLTLAVANEGIGLFGRVDAPAELKNIRMAKVDVEGTNSVGGLVGGLDGGTILNSSVIGRVEGGSDIGGIAGYANGHISGCFADVQVISTGDYIGGLVGSSNGSLIVENSYARGSVTGYEYVGALIGMSHGLLISSYADNDVEGNGTQYIGPVVGGYTYNPPSQNITSTYYNDIRVCSGCDNNIGANLTAAQMVDENTYNDNFSGFDFVNDWMHPGYGTPRLQWEDICIANQSFANGPGDGSAENPYLICSYNHLASIGTSYSTSHFALITDIDATNITSFPMIGDTNDPFEGVFDGHGRKIIGLVMNSDPTWNHVALFRVTDEAHIKNLVMDNSSVEGSAYVGTLVGQGTGTIENVHISGDIDASSLVGGLAGEFNGDIMDSSYNGFIQASGTVGGLAGVLNGGTISESFASASIEVANDYAGGLVGRLTSSQIANSYAWGDVQGGQRLGGLAGWADGATTSISYSYAMLDVSSMLIGLQNFYVGPVVGQQTNGATVSDTYYASLANCIECDTFLGTGLDWNDLADENSYTGWLFAPDPGYIWYIPPAGVNAPILYWQE